MMKFKLGRGYVENIKHIELGHLRLESREETIRRWESLGFLERLSEPSYSIGVDPATPSQDFTVFKHCDSLIEIFVPKFRAI